MKTIINSPLKYNLKDSNPAHLLLCRHFSTKKCLRFDSIVSYDPKAGVSDYCLKRSAVFEVHIHNTCLVFLLAIIFCLSPASSISAQVIVTEIQYDPQGSDSGKEWIELKNIGTTTIDLSSWKISDESSHKLYFGKNGSVGGSTLSPNTYAVIASNAITFISENGSKGIVVDSVLNLRNSGGSIVLSNASGTVMQKVKYSPLSDKNGGNSLQLIDGKWYSATPTPGHDNVKMIQPTEKVQTINAKASNVSVSKKNITHTKTKDTAPATLPKLTAAVLDTEIASKSQSDNVVDIGGSPNESRKWWMVILLPAALVSVVLAIWSRRLRAEEWNIVE